MNAWNSDSFIVICPFPIIIILIDSLISRNQKVYRYGVRVQIKGMNTIITTTKNSTVVSFTGKIHLIAINMNDDYNMDIKGGLCQCRRGAPVIFFI